MANRFFDRIQEAPTLETKISWLNDVKDKVLPRIVTNSRFLLENLPSVTNEK